MIQLIITKTGKSMREKQYSCYDIETKSFGSVTEAKAYLKDTYGDHKKSKMYCDMEGKEAVHIGYIYGFRNYQFEDGRRVWFFESHWVEFRKTESLDLQTV